MPPPGKPPPPASRVDFPVAVRGASRGFTILVIGNLLAQAILTLAPRSPGLIVAFAPYVIGSFVAARNTGQAASPVLHGIAASVGAYLLTLPLLLIWMLNAATGQSILYLATTLTLSLGIGALTGWMNASRQR